MDTYRIFRLDADGRTTQPAITLDCGADHEAIEVARELAGPDTLAILTHFGELPGDAGYSPRFDRQAGAQPYQTQPASGQNVGMDLGDALLNLQSFGHSCAGPL